MADISKITLPSGNTYEIKDAVAREMIAGGISFIVAWDGTAAPVVANVPAGVVITYSGTTYTGTLAAGDAQTGAFYLVKSSTQVGAVDIYDEYVVATVNNVKQWEKLGDTQIDLSNVVTGVTLNKQTDVVLGEATTFTLNNPTVSLTETKKYISGSASGTAVGANGTAAAITDMGTPTTGSFVTSVSADTTKKLVTTTVPNVTNAGSASTWSFAMGTGTGNTETLVISGANGSAPTLGTAKTVATGSVTTSGTGSAVVTDVTVGDTASAITALGTPTTANCLTGVKVTAQPTISLSSGDTSGTGKVQVVTDVPDPTVSGGSISVGTNDKVTSLTNSTSITVTKGS